MISFKSTLLEGLEVAFIVITLGANQGATGIAAAGAVAALVVVVIVGALVRHPLSRVPENTLKFAVGVMLTSFGTFWAGEGVGIDWPGAEIVTGGADRGDGRVVAALHATARPRAQGRRAHEEPESRDRRLRRRRRRRDRRGSARPSRRHALQLAHLGGEAWWLLPLGVPVSLWISLRRGSSARRAQRSRA